MPPGLVKAIIPSTPLEPLIRPASMCASGGDLSIRFHSNAVALRGFDVIVFRNAVHLAVLVFLFAVLFPSDAWAYLDPGTGSLFVQSTIAAAAAAGYALRLYWGRIFGWFRGQTAPADSEPHRPSTGPV